MGLALVPPGHFTHWSLLQTPPLHTSGHRIRDCSIACSSSPFSLTAKSMRLPHSSVELTDTHTNKDISLNLYVGGLPTVAPQLRDEGRRILFAALQCFVVRLCEDDARRTPFTSQCSPCTPRGTGSKWTGTGTSAGSEEKQETGARLRKSRHIYKCPERDSGLFVMQQTCDLFLNCESCAHDPATVYRAVRCDH